MQMSSILEFLNSKLCYLNLKESLAYETCILSSILLKKTATFELLNTFYLILSF